MLIFKFCEYDAKSRKILVSWVAERWFLKKTKLKVDMYVQSDVNM